MPAKNIKLPGIQGRLDPGISAQSLRSGVYEAGGGIGEGPDLPVQEFCPPHIVHMSLLHREENPLTNLLRNPIEETSQVGFDRFGPRK